MSSIAIVATLRVQDGKASEFETFFTGLAGQVRENEPGALLYHLAKSRTEANTYRVLEIYRDQEALTAHGGSPYFKAAGPQFRELLAGRPEIEILDSVG
jgi:quinol monooxygenase YgiN